MPVRLLRLTLLLGALALGAPQTAAQFSFGVAGGVNSLRASEARGFVLDRSAGFHAGLLADVGDRPFALRIGLFYVDGGGFLADTLDVDFPLDPSNPQAGTFTYALLPAVENNLRFLELPIELQYRFGLGGATPYALFGPNIRLQLGASEALSDELRSPSNVSMALGGGALFGSAEGGTPRLFAEVRYTFDLTGSFENAEVVIDETGAPVTPESETRFQTVLRSQRIAIDQFMIRVGLMF